LRKMALDVFDNIADNREHETGEWLHAVLPFAVGLIAAFRKGHYSCRISLLIVP